MMDRIESWIEDTISSTSHSTSQLRDYTTRKRKRVPLSPIDANEMPPREPRTPQHKKLQLAPPEDFDPTPRPRAAQRRRLNTSIPDDESARSPSSNSNTSSRATSPSKSSVDLSALTTEVVVTPVFDSQDLPDLMSLRELWTAVKKIRIGTSLIPESRWEELSPLISDNDGETYQHLKDDSSTMSRFKEGAIAPRISSYAHNIEPGDIRKTIKKSINLLKDKAPEPTWNSQIHERQLEALTDCYPQIIYSNMYVTRCLHTSSFHLLPSSLPFFALLLICLALLQRFCQSTCLHTALRELKRESTKSISVYVSKNVLPIAPIVLRS